MNGKKIISNLITLPNNESANFVHAELQVILSFYTRTNTCIYPAVLTKKKKKKRKKERKTYTKKNKNKKPKTNPQTNQPNKQINKNNKQTTPIFSRKITFA